MERVALLLGGNIGDVRSRLEHAITLLEQRVGAVVARSSLLESEPWGFERGAEQSTFTNQAVVVECELSAVELLDVIQQVEREVGRERDVERVERESRGERYASRKIDIDIIFYGEHSVASERLVIPHPLMQEREFVLVPLVEIAPDWRHTIYRRSCRELLNDLRER